MSDPIQRVIEVSQHLTELRRRLDELNGERSALEGQIAKCLEQLATLTAGQLIPPATGSLAERIIWLLRRDPKHPLAPSDVAYALGIQSKREIMNVRGLMSRMGREGRLRRVSHGRYLALDSA